MAKIIYFYLILSVVVSMQFAAKASERDFNFFLGKIEKFKYENFDSAKLYAEMAEDYALNSEDSTLIGRVFNQKGAIFYIAGEYGSSMKYFAEAYRIFEKQGVTPDLAISLNGRGLIYLGQHDYHSAIDVWEKCLRYNIQLKDSVAIGKTYFNLGIAKSEIAQQEEALSDLLKGLKFLENQPKNILIPMIKNRLGKVYMDIHQPEEALRYYTAVLNYDTLLTNWELAFVHTGLAEVYLAQKKYDLTVEEGLLGYQFAQIVKANWDNARVCEVLKNAYESKGAPVKALYYANQLIKYRELLYSQNKSSEINYLQLQLSESDNKRLVQEKLLAEQKAKVNQGINFILFFLVIGLVTVIYFYRKNLRLKEHFNRELAEKNKDIEQQKIKISIQNESLNEINQTKLKLFSILSHDLRSPINTIKQLLELHKEGFLSEEEKQQAFEVLSNQVHKTDKVLNNLLKWANTQLNGIETNKIPLSLPVYVDELIDSFAFQAKSKEIKILHDQNNWPEEVMVDKEHLRIILQNLLANAIKFTEEGGFISFSYSKNDSYIHLHLKDNGMGMEEKKRMELLNQDGMIVSTSGTNSEMGTGLGLMLVKQFLANNDSLFDIKSKIGKGTEFTLSFPIANHKEVLSFSAKQH